MDLGTQNILFLTRTMKLGGTENVILQLCEIFKPIVNNIVVCSSGGVNVEKLNELGIKHYLIPDIQGKKPLNMMRTLQIVRSIVKKENITVIHSHHRMAALYANLVSCKKITLIANAHNTFYDKKQLTRIAYKRNNLIAVGEHVKKNLVEFFGIQNENVTVIHNAVKPFVGEVVPIPELVKAKEKGKIIIGNIGRLSEQKGMGYFIKAAKKILEIRHDVCFFIVGDGEDAEKLKKMAQTLLLGDSLVFLGYRPDVQNVMSQMDFIVLSSLWEGLPLTPIEAFSVRKSVIATAVDGTPEIVADGKNGLLVEPKDVKQLIDAMIKMCQDTEMRQKCADVAYRTYADKFSFEILSKRYVNYYKEL